MAFPPLPSHHPFEQTTHQHTKTQRKQERLDELEARKGELTRKVDKAKAALRFSIPKHIAQGLENVARVVEEEGVRGCVRLFVGGACGDVCLRVFGSRQGGTTITRTRTRDGVMTNTTANEINNKHLQKTGTTAPCTTC